MQPAVSLHHSKNMNNQLTTRKIIKLWYSLLLTWMMMAFEGPFIAAVVARLENPKENLAAFGIAFALALIVEAPIIMIMSAGIALIKGKESFIKIKKFTYSLNTLITLFIIIILIPQIFNFIAVNIMQLSPEVAVLCRKGTFFMIPWAAAIGYRRLYHAVLIISNKTHKVALGTVIRLSSMTVTALLCAISGKMSGVETGTAALSAGVIMEALASRFMSLKETSDILKTDDKGNTLKYSYIISFYIPLALTSFVSMSIKPTVTFFMGYAENSLESLAVLPVLNSMIFIFSAVGLSYQEVALSLMGKNHHNYIKLRNFMLILVTGVTILSFILMFSPISDFYFKTFSGLTNELTEFISLPAKISFLLPALSVYLSFQRSFLVNEHKTYAISHSTFIELSGIVLILLFSIFIFHIPGAVGAAKAYFGGRIVSNIYLYFKMNKILKKKA